MAEADTFASVLAQVPWEEICLQLSTSMYLVEGGRRELRCISRVDGIIFGLSNRARKVA